MERKKKNYNIFKIGSWGPYLLLGDGRIRRCRRNQIKTKNNKIKTQLNWQSLPAEQYKQLTNNEIESLLRRLNAEHSAQIEFEKKQESLSHISAFWNPRLLEAFDNDVRRTTTRASYQRIQRRYLEKYVLPYFIILKKITDPKLWHRLEASWGEWLLDKGLSANYILKINNALTRYFRILKKNINDFPRLESLEPLGTAKIKDLKSNDKLGQYIPEEHITLIKSNISEDIKHLFLLTLAFGLRKREVFGLTTSHLLIDYLKVERQYMPSKDEVKDKFVKLKSKEIRYTPYWFITPSEALELISKIKLIHPDTFAKKFELEMKSLGFSYRLHDLRRTFITNALKIHHWTDVSKAVGHKNVNTTMLYLQDDRQVKERLFIDSDIFKKSKL